jgi:pSer/pThr/pTyr-binding forkhead associated (FHA) protein
MLIGRHRECDVRINSPKVSRRHCCVVMVYDRLLIRDLGSRNGVRHNGQIVEEMTLLSGDEVAIGPIIFRLEPVDDVQQSVVGRSSPTPAAAAPKAAKASHGLSAEPGNEIDLVPLDDD